MSKSAFRYNLDNHLKRPSTTEERRKAYGAFNLLGLKRVQDIPATWYLS